MSDRVPGHMMAAWFVFAVFAIAAYAPTARLLAQDNAPVANVDGAEALLPDRDNRNLVRETYIVAPFLRCPNGLIQWQPDWPQPIIGPDMASDDRFIGEATPLGNLIQFLLVGHPRETGVNHFAARPGELAVTNTPQAQKDVKQIFSALAAMPAMNPPGGDLRVLPGIQRINLGPHRCVTICTTSPTDGGEELESALYDVSDLVHVVTVPQLATLIKAIDRQSWDDAGGPGALAYYEPARAIAAVQTKGNHAKIKREMATWRGLAPANLQPPKRPHKPAAAVGAARFGPGRG